jgi:hypothetical protein
MLALKKKIRARTLRTRFDSFQFLSYLYILDLHADVLTQTNGNILGWQRPRDTVHLLQGDIANISTTDHQTHCE